jgi:hypothetical protein
MVKYKYSPKTKMSAKKKSSRLNKKWLLVSLIAVIVVGIIIGELTNTTHLFHKSPKVSTPETPITQLPTQPVANDGNKQSTSSGINKQTSTDQNGEKPQAVSNNPGDWLISQSGLTTVKSPTSNSLFKSGDSLYGSSKQSIVQYRLIDNDIGVISEGTISVVNGNFSGLINFQARGSAGRLDVFNADENGRESNEVQVPVKFK